MKSLILMRDSEAQLRMDYASGVFTGDFQFGERIAYRRPFVGRDYLAFDKQNPCETHGSVQVSITLVADPFATADPTTGSTSDLLWKCVAGLPAPSGLLISDDTKKLRQGTWTGHRDDRVEVDAACWILLQGGDDSFPDILCQVVHVGVMTMNLNFRFGFVVVRIHDLGFDHLFTFGAFMVFI